MGLYTDNAAHKGRDLIDPHALKPRPLPRQMPQVTVFPAGSIGARTPSAHDVETQEVLNYGLLPCEQPFQNEAAAFPHNRPIDDVPWNRGVKRQDDAVRHNKGGFLRSFIARYERRVEASIGP